MGTPPGGESSSAPCMAASGVTSTISPITRDSWPSDRTIPNRTPGFRRISSALLVLFYKPVRPRAWWALWPEW